MNIVCQYYAGYIAHLSMRKLRDERGNNYYGIDEDNAVLGVREEVWRGGIDQEKTVKRFDIVDER